jgi:hypothetical protein
MAVVPERYNPNTNTEYQMFKWNSLDGTKNIDRLQKQPRISEFSEDQIIISSKIYKDENLLCW